MTPDSQCSRILAHLQGGNSITGLEALLLFGCIHLPRRIKDLREIGHDIHSQMIVLPNGKRVAEYRLIKCAEV